MEEAEERISDLEDSTMEMICSEHQKEGTGNKTESQAPVGQQQNSSHSCTVLEVDEKEAGDKKILEDKMAENILNLSRDRNLQNQAAKITSLLHKRTQTKTHNNKTSEN